MDKGSEMANREDKAEAREGVLRRERASRAAGTHVRGQGERAQIRRESIRASLYRFGAVGGRAPGAERLAPPLPPGGATGEKELERIRGEIAEEEQQR